MPRERTMNAGKNKAETPPEFFARLDSIFKFTLDVCAEPETAKVDNFFTEEDDALAQDWGDHICWMNPPYGNPEHPCKKDCRKRRCEVRGFHTDRYIPGISDWVEKAWLSSLNGATVVGLLPSATGPQWFHKYVMQANKLILVEGRLRFLNKGKPMGTPDFDSIVAVWEPPIAGIERPFPSLLSMKAYL